MSHDTEHAELRERLSKRYAIRGEYVDASTLATILCMGRTTVHEHMAQGRFVIPHRLINRKPVAKLDDLVDWMLGKSWEPQALAAPARPTAAEEAGIAFKSPAVERAYAEVLERLDLR